MKIQVGDIVKHGTFMDVALLVVRSKPNSTFDCHWVNQGMNKTYVIDTSIMSIEILDENLNQWFKCKNPDAECIRYEQWEQLKGIENDN